MHRTGSVTTGIGFIAALLVLGGIAVTAYRSAHQALADDQLVTHTYDVLEKLQAIRITLASAETAARGYLITGQEQFLAPYESRRNEVPDRLDALQTLTRDNARQQERIAQLRRIVRAKLSSLADQVAARRASGFADAQSIVASGEGQALMDTISDAVAVMESDERQLLAQRIDRNEHSQTFAQTAIVAGNILAGLLLAGAFSVIYDENKRRTAAEEAAVLERNRLDLILASLGEGVVATDAQGRFSLFNPMAEILVGRGADRIDPETRSEHYGIFRPDRTTPYSYDELPLTRAIRGERCHNIELFIRNKNRPDGVPISATSSPLRNDAGTIVGGVVVLSDISERLEHEDAITRKNDELALAYAELDRTRLQQLQTKDQLLSHVSHELRTPLTAAFQFVEILRDGLAGELNGQQMEFVEVALRNLIQLRTMIGDLLDATRLESAKLTVTPTRMDLTSVVSDVCRTLYSPAAEKQVRLENRVANIPDIYADTSRVRQIVTNVLHNAIKFTENGSITIDATLIHSERPFVEVTIADTGCGMAPDTVNRIFTRLYQAEDPRAESRQGLGLGLFICKELITRQGGEIWAESELGSGSAFHCTFPVFSNPEP